MLEFLLEFLVFSTLKIYGIKEKRCPIADWIRRGLYLYKYICGSGGGLTQKIPREILQMGNGDYTYIYTISVGVICIFPHASLGVAACMHWGGG